MSNDDNIGYAIAYLDENGKGFTSDIPNIITVKESDIKHKIKSLHILNYKRITIFQYNKPCTFLCDWDYIEKNKVL